jgi:translation initiation factor 3 subunit I
MLGIESNDPVIEINVSENGPKATVAVFAPLSDHIITGHENGKIGKYDVKSGKEVNRVVEDGHRGEITDIQLSPDGTYFITSSKDKTARVGQDPSGNVA